MNIFHFSDIHFRKNWHENHGLVFNALFRDIKKMISEDDSNIAIFSGDIVQAGDDVDSYEEFINYFDHALNNIGISKDNRYCVPGNHDLSRNIIEKNFIEHEGVISQEINESEFNDYVESCSNYFNDKFCNYKIFERKFTNNKFISNNFSGHGFSVDDDFGIFCLNTSIFSSAGLSSPRYGQVVDKNRLCVDTRRLSLWLQETHKVRILVMHHPVSWLSPWAKREVENLLHNHFNLCFSGHSHEQGLYHSFINDSNLVCFSAPPIFSTKYDNLGYSIIKYNIDTNFNNKIIYRHYSKHQVFATGSYFSGTEDGTISINLKNSRDESLNSHIKEYFASNLDEALTVFTSQPRVWVNPKLSRSSEVDNNFKSDDFINIDEILRSDRSFVVKAPPQFGLTCLAHYLILEAWARMDSRWVYLDLQVVGTTKKGIQQYVEHRLKQCGFSDLTFCTIVVDSFYVNNKRNIRILELLYELYPHAKLVILETIDVRAGIDFGFEKEFGKQFDVCYLWSMSREDIRGVVVKYNCEKFIGDEDAVLNRIVSDIDVLNIHRTPLNCLTVLKASEVSFSESPVNRTEMLRRVLFILFCIDNVPKYKTFPDMQDCEYALGYFCEMLLKEQSFFFTKQYFVEEIQKFCKHRFIDLEVSNIFNILNSNHIIVQVEAGYKFKFSYWIYYFIAQRMHHDKSFSEYMLSSMNYVCYPEVIEFYTGVDRRREDAISVIINDVDRCISVVQDKCGLPEDFNVFKYIKWTPSLDQVEKMEAEFRDGIEESNLPDPIKDKYADKDYDRTKPYDQAVREFLNEQSLISLMLILCSACRALRNSDYIDPELKKILISKIIKGWRLITQILLALLPLLADKGYAVYDGAGFILTGNFGDDSEQRARNILTQIPSNIVKWYKDDLYSPKMSSLLENIFVLEKDEIILHELSLFLIYKRPHGWISSLKKYINSLNKNSFYLLDVDRALRNQYKYSYISSEEINNISYLIKMCVAKHSGSKNTGDSAVNKIPDKILPDRECG